MPIASGKGTPAPATKTVPLAAKPLPANKNSRPAATSGGATARTYEIHRNSGGRWLLDSVADEKDVAIAMATALLGGARAPSEVRVNAVQIKLDGAFSEVTIFRGTPEEQRASEADTAKARRSEDRSAGHPRMARDTQTAAPRRKRPRRDLKTTILAMKTGLANVSPRNWLAIGAVLVWCAIFYAWRQPQTPWAFDSPAAHTVAKQRLP
jgi:hypothetical protein